MVHLHLVEGALDHLDRILDGADIHLRGGQLAQGGVKRGGLARAGRPRHQHDAVALAGHAVPAREVLVRQAQLLEGFLQHIRVENPHHQFFAKSGGQGGQAQFHLVALGAACFQATVLGSAFFRHVHAAEDLDAAGHRRAHLLGQLVDTVQYPVDAEPHFADIAPWLDMDIAGALLERVLQQPVDNIDDVLVVGIGLLHRSQLQHLLEVGHPGTSVSPVGATGPVYRAGHGIKLGGVAGDEPGIGQHPAHALAQHVFQVALPGLDVRFAAGDHHLLVVDLHRQDAVALGEGPGHDLGDGGDVDL